MQRASPEPTDFRSLKVEEYLQARALAAKTQTAYRQDLQHFLRWTNLTWADVTPRLVTRLSST
ncbi:site-specific integrase [Phormidium tenue FACHB-886]|nr:site-specific integrase [Phormidium tenue FACHB-886]